jgi:hypothetical protein
MRWCVFVYGWLAVWRSVCGARLGCTVGMSVLHGGMSCARARVRAAGELPLDDEDADEEPSAPEPEPEFAVDQSSVQVDSQGSGKPPPFAGGGAAAGRRMSARQPTALPHPICAQAVAWWAPTPPPHCPAPVVMHQQPAGAEGTYVRGSHSPSSC